MAVSTITSKFQTTVPREVRRRLKLVKNALIEWDVEGGRAIVTPRKVRFLDFAGVIKVGRGSVKADIKAARRLRAREIAEKAGV